MLASHYYCSIATTNLDTVKKNRKKNPFGGHIVVTYSTYIITGQGIRCPLGASPKYHAYPYSTPESLRLFSRMVSLMAAKTSLILDVSVA